MKRMMKQSVSLLLALVLLMGLYVPAEAADKRTVDKAVEETAAYIHKAVDDPIVNSVGGEWAVLGLARSGANVPQQYWNNYVKNVGKTLQEVQGVAHRKKYTEYSRVILGLTSVGADPTNVAGYNLLTPLGDFDRTIWQGINGPIWALIALDTNGYAIPYNPNATRRATRQMYINEILNRQLTSGGWNLRDRGGNGSVNVDITGMALTALARYMDQPAVKKAVDKALTCLSKMQNAQGGYGDSVYGESSEAIVQVIVGLTSLGIDLKDPRFVKNGSTLVDALLTFRMPDKSFCHTKDSGSNLMATEQALYALTAVKRAAEGKNDLYDMRDTKLTTSSALAGSFGLPGKDADIRKLAPLKPGTSFSDVKGHANQTAIEALAARGIIGGWGDGSFSPNQTMTRAQFAAVVVRALGLPLQEVKKFTDVPSGAWHAGFIGTAVNGGIVNGVTATMYQPNGTITRQQAAAMVSRAARLCGVNTDMTDAEVNAILAKVKDASTISAPFRENVAFCIKSGIWAGDSTRMQPRQPILRCEIAQMVYGMMKNADLL